MFEVSGPGQWQSWDLNPGLSGFQAWASCIPPLVFCFVFRPNTVLSGQQFISGSWKNITFITTQATSAPQAQRLGHDLCKPHSIFPLPWGKPPSVCFIFHREARRQGRSPAPSRQRGASAGRRGQPAVPERPLCSLPPDLHSLSEDAICHGFSAPRGFPGCTAGQGQRTGLRGPIPSVLCVASSLGLCGWHEEGRHRYTGMQ